MYRPLSKLRVTRMPLDVGSVALQTRGTQNALRNEELVTGVTRKTGVIHSESKLIVALMQGLTFALAKRSVHCIPDGPVNY
ncbi:hypothetical protein BaRGS_00036864 [Batillaria attramentaria]|uniref:Uncharacterized protein n=1 Tax=Batillaria attramentaria TaxID=370345 RepID=A0ABD0JAH7_9CAEN